MATRTYGPTPLSPAVKPGTSVTVLDTNGDQLPLLSGPTNGGGGLTFTADDGGAAYIRARILWQGTDGDDYELPVAFGATPPTDPTPGPLGVILVSPNSTKYRLKVANDGTLSTEAV